MQIRAPSGSTGSTVRIPWFVALAFFVMVVAAVLSITSAGEVGHVAGTFGIFVGNLLAGILFIVRSRKLETAERRAWTLVGTGLTVAAGGIIIVAAQVSITGDASTFGPTDLFFIVGYSTALVGFASLPHTAGTSLQRLRTAFDGMIGAVAIGALLWTLVLLPVVEGLADAETWERIIGSIYPLIDLAVVVIIMMITVCSRSQVRCCCRQ